MPAVLPGNADASWVTAAFMDADAGGEHCAMNLGRAVS